MAKIRLNPLCNSEYDFPQIKGESLQSLFDRFAEETENVNEQTKEYFIILIDGYQVDPDFWPYFKPKPIANILIAIKPQGGEDAPLFGQIAVLAVVIASAYIPGAPVWLPAAAGFAASLIVNSLIKPPPVDIAGLSSGYQAGDSQMYSITGQSNQVKLYGIVPKVYGKHRVFPTIAANPYTDLETAENGELSQFFFAIYDIGLGPAVITDVRIGDTPISAYGEAFYRLVDPNKPDTDEGEWDTATTKTFQYYKGDNEVTEVGVTFPKNSTDPGAIESEYLAVRSAGSTGDGDEQQINLHFSLPQGLIAYNNQGQESTRTVELLVEFAEVGLENWAPFNDLAAVDTFQIVSNIDQETKSITLYYESRATTLNTPYLPYYDVISAGYLAKYKMQAVTNSSFVTTQTVGDIVTFPINVYGFKKGNSTFVSQQFIQIDNMILNGYEIVGKIKTRTEIKPSVFQYTLYSPWPKDIPVFTEYVHRKTSNNITFQYLSWFDWPGSQVTSPSIMPNTLIQEDPSGTVKIVAAKDSPIQSYMSFKPKTDNQVKVRVTRSRSYSAYNYRTVDNITWSNITTRYDREPIVTTKRHTFVEVKIRATDQLNGAIQNLNMVASSVLDIYDGSDWALGETNNPAWIYSDLLKGEINKKPLAVDQLDTTSILEWATFCSEIPTAPVGQTFELGRYESNFVLDYKTTLMQLITQLTSSSQASLNVVNGKYGVLIDKDKTVPTQVFTPRNSSGFKSTKNFSELPDAIRVNYIDESSSWNTSQLTVYSDGYTEVNAVDFDELGTFGCTNYEQSWRFGRYNLAQAKLRKENIGITVDFENLICTRGDYVLLQHDVMKVGGSPARVKSIVSNVVTIDQDFVTVPLTNYGYTIRGIYGIKTSTMTITGLDTATLDGDLPNAGDLIVWGEVDKITIDCIVKAITPSQNESARLTLVEKADAIYTAESTDTLPDYTPNLTSGGITAPSEVQDLAISDSIWDCNGTQYVYYVDLTWTPPLEGIVDAYEAYVDVGEGYELSGLTQSLTYRHEVNTAFIDQAHSFKVLGVSATGEKLILGGVTAVTDTPASKTTAPSDVEDLFANVLNETLQLDWSLVDDCDVNEYEIRFSPSLSSNWQTSVRLQVVGPQTNQVSVQARTGSYFIKAKDFNKNESATAAKAITSIPELFNLNVIDETNDFPDLLGVKDRVEKLNNDLVAVQTAPGVYEPLGYYYYENFLDLGEIYTVRLQSLIEAEGFLYGDVMAQWVTLDSVTALSTVATSDWNVETEYRGTDSFNVMSEWPSMSAISPISEGDPDNWTLWRKFTITDASARIFQFRLKLISNRADVTPRIFDGVIKSDMPDRVYGQDNIVTAASTYSATYSPAFKGPGTTPNLQITFDDASQGDYYVITNKTLAGFDITFYDKTDTVVSRQFDYQAKGYGRLTTSTI